MIFPSFCWKGKVRRESSRGDCGFRTISSNFRIVDSSSSFNGIRIEPLTNGFDSSWFDFGSKIDSLNSSTIGIGIGTEPLIDGFGI